MPNFVTYEKVERAAKLVQNLTIIFAIFGALFSYSSAQLDKRIAAATDFRKQYLSDIRTAYLGLQSRWDSPATDGVRSSNRRAQQNATLDFFAIEQNKTALLNVVDFFDSLGICVQGGLCDQNTALTMFADQIRNTFETSAEYIEAKRAQDNDNSFGAGLEMLYHARRQCWFSRYL